MLFKKFYYRFSQYCSDVGSIHCPEISHEQLRWVSRSCKLLNNFSRLPLEGNRAQRKQNPHPLPSELGGGQKQGRVRGLVQTSEAGRGEDEGVDECKGRRAEQDVESKYY